MGKTVCQSIIFMHMHSCVELTGNSSQGQHIQFVLQELNDQRRIAVLLPLPQKLQTIAALITLDVLIDAQQTILAFTDPEGVKIVYDIDDRKGYKAPLTMHILHKLKARLKLRPQVVKSVKFLLH